MNWETANTCFDDATTTVSGTSNNNDIIREENEQKRLFQLQKFKSRDGEQDKTIYHKVMSQFGQLLTNNNKEQIIQNILTEDCEIFLFNFTDTGPEYAFRPEGFLKLFERKRVITREVRETCISLSKATGFQICEGEVIDETKGSSMSQFSFEAFSFRDNKISKIRSSYGSMPASYNPSSLFILTKKERMLAKVKELNYAWADQPDFERIASLMHADTEYKFWRWKDKKCFIFDKRNLVSEFKKSLEEDFIITSVVPYGISSEAQYIFGSYVYHLEDKHGSPKQRFIWASTCIYTFDKDYNIKKMSQQGELYPEGETLIPFQAHCMEKLLKPPEQPKTEKVEPKNMLSIFETDKINFSFDIILFGPRDDTFTGHIKGLSQIDVIEKIIAQQHKKVEEAKQHDVFYDIDDTCYDSVIVIESNKGTINREGHPFQGILMSFYDIGKISFENGKVAKILFFPCEIPNPIPSPFDDTSFSELNFRPKSEFLL